MFGEMSRSEALKAKGIIEKVSFCDMARKIDQCTYRTTGCSDCHWNLAKHRTSELLAEVANGNYRPERIAHKEKEPYMKPRCSACAHIVAEGDGFCGCCGAKLV